MKLGKGIVWVIIVTISALISAALHIPALLSFPWGMMTAAIAYLITRRMDLSQSRFLGALVTMEKYRLPALVVTLPLSLILLPLSAGQMWAFWVGISATLIALAIMISYTVDRHITKESDK